MHLSVRAKYSIHYGGFRDGMRSGNSPIVYHGANAPEKWLIFRFAPYSPRRLVTA